MAYGAYRTQGSYAARNASRSGASGQGGGHRQAGQARHAGRAQASAGAGRAAYDRSRYAYGSAAVDFEQLEREQAQTSREHERVRELGRKPRLRAHDGAGRKPAGISYAQSLLFKAVIACAALIAAAAFISVWMNASTLQTMANTERLAGQIKTAQAATTNLELEHSRLTSPARLESAAAGLGMSVDTDASFIEVDAVPSIATFSNGKISISGTIESARAAAACD